MTEITDDLKEYYSENFMILKNPGREFSNFEFEGCEFQDCDFNQAKFIECRFRNCMFRNCNLSLIKINESQFTNVEFHQCKMLGIDWTKALWPKLSFFIPFKFLQCFMNDSSFFGLKLEGIVIEECRACYTDFREANFKKARFCSSELINSMFHQTNLIEADFSGATNYDIDIYSNKIRGAKFNRFEAVRLLESIGIEIVD